MTSLSSRPVLILLASSALGLSLSACASPNFPIAPGELTAQPTSPRAAPAPAQPQLPSEDPPPETPRPTAPVESRPLDLPPPPPRSEPPAPSVDTAPPAPQAAPAPARQAPPPPPTFRTVTTRSVTGRVVEVEGPRQTYTVKKGDNLERIARRLDTDVETLAKDNKLKKPYIIQPGDELKGPRTSAKAYVVGQGDTLFAVARRFSVTAEALREENELRRNATLRPGQRLRLPSGYRDRGAIVTTERVRVDPPAERQPTPAPAQIAAAPPTVRTPAPTTSAAAPPVRRDLPPIGAQPPSRSETPPALPSAPRPYTPPQAQPRPAAPPPSTNRPPAQATAPITGAPVASPPPSESQLTSLGRGRFIWPARGEVLSSFGPRGPGQRNDGVNIRANTGEPVRASAAGDVVYAGDQVPGFGNLVLIKHADGWVTAYGHLSRVDVRMQQKVTQGQQIGQVGSTGGVSEPQLHFEVRYAPTPEERARPIDPALVLPPR